MKFKLGEKVTVRNDRSFHPFIEDEELEIVLIDDSITNPYLCENENGEQSWMYEDDIQ